MSLNRGLDTISQTHAQNALAHTVAVLELKIIALEAKVEELEKLANTQQQLNQKLLDIVTKLT